MALQSTDPRHTPWLCPPGPVPSCQGHRGSPADTGATHDPEKQRRRCSGQVLPSSPSLARNSLAQWLESLLLGDGGDADAVVTGDKVLQAGCGKSLG